MKELREIMVAYDAAVALGKRCALATVVHVDGSSYRRPGARMLVTEDGELTGAISGGCLEGDALRKALHVITQQKKRLVTYDTTDEEDASIGIQLGCSGVIQVLFEPIPDVKAPDAVELIRKASALRQKAVLVTLFTLDDKRHQQPGTCLLLPQNGNITGNYADAAFREAIIEDAWQVLKQGRSLFKAYRADKATMTAFIEYIPPAISLVVIGAGNDAVPLMQIATILGWEVRIVDGRNTHAKPERFASACQVLVSKPGQVLEQIPIDEYTFFVLMTHNYQYDLAMLKALAGKAVRYIGLLGPRKKYERMLADLAHDGFHFNESQQQIVFAPVGLELGAETAEEIALSIIAEIMAVLNGKPGTSLRHKDDVIHAREDTQIYSRDL